MQENQPAAQIAAKHNIFSSDGAIYVMNLLGAGGNQSRGLLSRLGGEIVSHNTTDARQYTTNY